MYKLAMLLTTHKTERQMHPFNTATINMSAVNNSIIAQYQWTIGKTTAIYMVADEGFAEEWAPDFMTHPEHIDTKIKAIYNEYTDKHTLWNNDTLRAQLVEKVEAHADLVDYINGLLRNAEFVECCAQGEGL
jgi:hypothetical protein